MKMVTKIASMTLSQLFVLNLLASVFQTRIGVLSNAHFPRLLPSYRNDTLTQSKTSEKSYYTASNNYPCLPPARHQGYKIFSCLTQLRMNFQLLMKTKMLENIDLSCFESLRCCIYHGL